MSQQTKLNSKHITKLPFLSLPNLQNLLPLNFLSFFFLDYVALMSTVIVVAIMII